MPFPVPDMYKITAATNSVDDMMAALYAHWSGASTKFIALQPTSVSAGDTGSYSYTLQPRPGSLEYWNVSFRNSGSIGTPSTTDVKVALDPKGDIRDPTDPSTTASLEWTGELTSFNYVSGSLSGEALVLEWADALMVLFYGTAGDFWPKGFHLGRVYVPLSSSDAEDTYRDGLGLLGSIPSNLLVPTSWTSSTATAAVFRTGQTTWIGKDDWPATVTAGMLNVGADTNVPVPLMLYLSSKRYLGFLKYLQGWTGEVARTRLQNGSGVFRYMFVSSGAGTSTLVVPCDNTTIP